MTDFCHIVPTPHLDLVSGRPVHLVLAHLIEEDEDYCSFYRNCGGDIIMDNSAFEMFKRNEPMYPTDKLIDMAMKVNANYVVMSDYPTEPAQKTINAACNMIPKLKGYGLKTFFCPQSEKGDIEGLMMGYAWAFSHPDIDYVAFSILNIPIAYGVESGNKLQKFLSRWKFMNELDKRFDLDLIHRTKKFHFLGMTEGPNEIELVSDYLQYIDTWDSSAAVWAGLNNIPFDNSPTGLINGKFETEVDFSYQNHDTYTAEQNIKYIDNMLEGYYNG